MNKIFLKGFSLGILITITGFAFAVQAAVNLDGLTYPIAELSNCQNEEECATYCEKIDNMESCITYGADKGMISQEEAGIARKAVVRIKAGTTPGGCTDRDSCVNFCQNNISNLSECISFAEEIGVPNNEIAQAKQIAKALEKGAGLPGNCQGKSACEAYCKGTAHIDECLLFAEAAELLPPEELAEAKKIANFIKSGEMPGNCQDKDECKAYCDKDENFEECITFAGKAELISPEEFDIAKKTGGKGPGDCKSRETCLAYCNMPENAKVCADFAVEKKIVSDEEADNIKNGASKVAKALSSMPPEVRGEVESCLNNLLDGNLSGFLSGQMTLTEKQGGGVANCFSQAGGGPTDGQGMSGPPEGMNIDVSDTKNLPSDIQAKIEQEMQDKQREAMEKYQPKDIPGGEMPDNIPKPDIPTNQAPPNIPVGQIPPDVPQPQIPANIPQGPDCSGFAGVPSCSMVGGGVAGEMCKKCFPNK